MRVWKQLLSGLLKPHHHHHHHVVEGKERPWSWEKKTVILTPENGAEWSGVLKSALLNMWKNVTQIPALERDGEHRGSTSIWQITWGTDEWDMATVLTRRAGAPHPQKLFLSHVCKSAEFTHYFSVSLFLHAESVCFSPSLSLQDVWPGPTKVKDTQKH